MNIGWIGLGQIGLPMVLALLEHGHRVTAVSRRPHEHQAVLDLGGELVSTPAQTLKNIDALGINVFSEDQLEVLLLGDTGVLFEIPAGTIVYIHSTVSPAFIQKIKSKREDVFWLDCAFSGTSHDVKNCNLTLMVGGEPETLERVKDVLSCYSRHIHHIGASGAGMTLKIINNSLFAANVQLALDALGAAAECGIEVNLAANVLSQSSGGSYALDSLTSGGSPLETSKSMMKYLEKDVKIARDAVTTSNIDLKNISVLTAKYLTQQNGILHYTA